MSEQFYYRLPDSIIKDDRRRSHITPAEIFEMPAAWPADERPQQIERQRQYAMLGLVVALMRHSEHMRDMVSLLDGIAPEKAGTLAEIAALLERLADRIIGLRGRQ